MRFVVALLLVVSLCGVAQAQEKKSNDWPGWRGADRSDVSQETGLLQKWPKSGPKKLWSNKLGGLGYGGFSVVGDTVYSVGAKDGSEYLFAMNVKSGKLKWSNKMGDLYENKWGDGPRSTPTVDGGFVYAMSARGNLVCVKARDGKGVWWKSMTKMGGKIPRWGYAESPLVDGNKVVVTPGGSGGTVAAFNKKNGKLLWRSTGVTDQPNYSSIVKAKIAGKEQYVQLVMNKVFGVNPKNGKLLWKHRWRGSTAVIPTPIVKGDEVYITSGYGAGCMKVKVSADGSAKQVYRNTVMKNHHGGVILVDGFLYGHSDRTGWVCQDFDSGELVWRERREVGKGCVAYADGRLYLVDENSGEVALIAATDEGWEEHGRFQMKPLSNRRKPMGKIWVHPVISNGRLFLRDQEVLHCYDIRSKT